MVGQFWTSIDKLDLPGLGPAVRLLALAPLGLGLAHRNASAVEADIECRRITGFGFDDAALVLCNFPSKRLSLAFHGLGINAKVRQFVDDPGTHREAELAPGDAHHAQHRW